ncbi:small basic family protein [Peptoclostridium sp.]|uniref:small basic family protein n=1 Tax=Peptoclostridium sp. TaxID=1904860 RepID=UPI002ED50274
MNNLIAAIIGLVLGILIGFYIPFTYPDSYTLYISVGILASLDSVFGAIRASLEGKYNNSIFITGFFTNAILAGFLAYLGDKLGVPLYYAPIIVFGGRLFDNFAVIRRVLLGKMMDKKKTS